MRFFLSLFGAFECGRLFPDDRAAVIGLDSAICGESSDFDSCLKVSGFVTSITHSIMIPLVDQYFKFLMELSAFLTRSIVDLDKLATLDRKVKAERSHKKAKNSGV
jgi:hypothetical protein